MITAEHACVLILRNVCRIPKVINAMNYVYGNSLGLSKCLWVHVSWGLSLFCLAHYRLAVRGGVVGTRRCKCQLTLLCATLERNVAETIRSPCAFM